jgi:PAS domain S-box-containing protein
MENKNRKKDQCIKELRQKIKELEKSEIEHKEVEEALQESEEKLAGIVSSVTDHMSMVDEEHNIVWANDVAKRLFGADVIGKKCYSAYHRRDKVCEPCVVSKTFADGKIHEHETEVIGFDGKKMIFWCTASVAARYKDGRPKMVIEISREITQHKKAEELLKKQREELSAFAHTVSHDLKNYITIIQSYANFLLLKKEGAKENTQRIIDTTKKMEEFVTRQLELADAGKEIGELEEINLNKLIDEVRKIYAIEMHREELPKIKGDPRQLREVFHNLIDNAIKHGEADEIEISSEKKKDSYIIYVKDNGRGISKEEIDKIFDMGYSKTGTGFGLTIVKKIVEAHGGSISVRSEEGKGTIFEIVFPIKA